LKAQSPKPKRKSLLAGRATFRGQNSHCCRVTPILIASILIEALAPLFAFLAAAAFIAGCLNSGRWRESSRFAPTDMQAC
jgi:hypothetical protein